MNFEDLMKEQQEAFASAQTPEELFALAKEEGVERADKDLEKVSGGAWRQPEVTCPKCGSTNTDSNISGETEKRLYSKCLSCGHQRNSVFGVVAPGVPN